MRVKTKEAAKTLDLTRPLDEPQMGVLVGETITDPVKLKDYGFTEQTIGRGRMLAEGAKDDDPEFVVVRTEEGWNTNETKLYDGAVLQSVAEQVVALQPIGHLGHIPDDQLSTSFGDPQTTWFGALVKDELSQDKRRVGEMVKVIYTAGYNLPGAKVRQYLKTAVVKGTSWFGRADHIPIPGKGYHIKNLELLTLDWARKLSEGMPTSSVVAIAREMKEGSNSMEKELAQVTPDEFKEANPNGHALLVREVTTEYEGKISEMQTKIDEAEEDKNLLAEVKAALKLGQGEDLLTKIAHLVTRLGEKAKIAVEDALDAVLGEKVPDEATRKIVKGLMQVKVAEMEDAASKAPDVESANRIVREMTTAVFDGDENIQSLVSEQSPVIIGKPDTSDGTGNDLDKALAATGMTRQRVKVGG